MAYSDDDFDEAWNDDEDKTASDPLKYIAKRISDIEALAIERLAAENITPAYLQEINYQAVVGTTVICKQDVFTNKLPAAVKLPAETWASCQAVKFGGLNINQQSVVVQFLIRRESELLYPKRVDKEIRKRAVDYGAKGGKTRDKRFAPDRQLFKDTYRKFRDESQEGKKPKRTPLVKLAADHLEKSQPQFKNIAHSTLMTWAKQADVADGFDRTEKKE